MHRLRGLRAGMPGRRDQARHRAGAREMAVAERGIRENLAKYYGQKRAPARSGRGSRTNSSTSRQIPARVIEADSARAATFTFAVCQPWCGRRVTSVIPFAAIERPVCKARMILVSREPVRARGVDLRCLQSGAYDRTLLHLQYSCAQPNGPTTLVT